MDGQKKKLGTNNKYEIMEVLNNRIDSLQVR